jgi:uncharacterized protein YndB with AHSA1/START domain
MTSTDRTVGSQTDAIAFEFDLQHPPEKVWRALTDPALLEEWLLPVVDRELELATGASFTLRTKPQPGWDGTVRCRLVEIDPPRKLSYTWTVGDSWLDTVVTFTLTPTPSGTLLSLEQSGFAPDQRQAWGGARYGWKMMGERLVELLGRTA